MKDASGLIHVTENLFLAVQDTGQIASFFKLDTSSPQNLHFIKTGKSLNIGRGDLDFESLAVDGDTFYITASFDSSRRNRMFSFKLQGSPLALNDLQRIRFSPPLSRKVRNIEALTILKENQLLVGFRKPRTHNKKRALALLVDATNGEVLGKWLKFNLGTYAFRDWERLNNGKYLILAGPQGGQKGKPPRRIYLWDGLLSDNTMKPLLCKIDLLGIRAEGICVRQQANNRGLELLIGTDEKNDNDTFKLYYLKINTPSDLLLTPHPLQEVAVEV